MPERLILFGAGCIFLIAIIVSKIADTKAREANQNALYNYNRAVMIGYVSNNIYENFLDECYKTKAFFRMHNSGTLPKADAPAFEYKPYSSIEDYYL